MPQENTPILLIVFGLIISLLIYRKLIPIIIKPNLGKQYDIFSKLGLRLNNPFKLSDLLIFENENITYKRIPYKLLYINLGSKSPDNKPYSNDCLTIDMELIDDSGCYSELLKDIERITKGDIIFKSINDVVDIENQKVKVTFTLNDKYYSWDLKYDFDWIDLDFFSKIQSLTNDIDSERKFNLLVDGQYIVLGYNTIEELHEIRSMTKLKITWI